MKMKNNPLSKRDLETELEDLKRDESGCIILKRKDYEVSDVDVGSYATTNSWIRLKGNHGCLIKNLFCDITFEKLNEKEKKISRYNNILLPCIGQEVFRNKYS